MNQDRGAVGLHTGPGGRVLGGGGVSVREAREGECEGRNGSSSAHERRGWQEDRRAKRLVDDSLMQKPEEVSNESRGGWLGDLSPTKQSQGLKEEWSADGAWLPQ